MATLFKRALGLFVEFNDDEPENPQANSTTFTQAAANIANNGGANGTPTTFKFSTEQIEKFETHFEQLMDQANLPGPDYYEYCKMMETLEHHLPDENARMSAVFATLSVQGMTKEKLIATANSYKGIIETDHQNFEGALSNKAQSDINDRKQKSVDLQAKIKANADTIQALTKQITEMQAEIGALTKEIAEGEAKIETNQKGYLVAYQAMLNKIDTDIKKINNTI